MSREARVKQVFKRNCHSEVDFLKIELLNSDQLLNDAKSLYDRWPSLTPENKREIVEQVTDKVLISKEEIKIKFTYTPHIPTHHPQTAADFQRNLIPALAFCGFDVAAPMPKPLKYPKSLITIADHLKKRRMDLKLLQEDVASIVGVTTDCITNWENSRAFPQIQYMPSIIAFLGYNPAPLRSQTFGDRIKEYRLLHGLSHKRLGKKLGVDGSTVSSWETGKFQPQPESRVKVLHLLTDDEPAMT